MERKVKFIAIERPSGHNEFKEWILKLPKQDQAKLLYVIHVVEQEGLMVARRMKWVKKISGEDNLFELRSKVSSNIQRAFYFHVKEDKYLITHGFTKKTQKTPKSEIAHAKEIRKEWYKYHG